MIVRSTSFDPGPLISAQIEFSAAEISALVSILAVLPGGHSAASILQQMAQSFFAPQDQQQAASPALSPAASGGIVPIPQVLGGIAR